MYLLLSSQGPVLSVSSGPGNLCCCTDEFVTLHKEPGENPSHARGDETCAGILAESGVRILVRSMFLHH